MSSASACGLSRSPVFWITCQPNSDRTGSLISPTSSSARAAENSGTYGEFSGSDQPRSPPRDARAGVVAVLLGDRVPVGVVGLEHSPDLLGLGLGRRPLLVGGLRLVLEARVGGDEDVPRSHLRDRGAADRRDEDLGHPSLVRGRHDHGRLEVLAVRVVQDVAADELAVLLVADAVAAQQGDERPLAGRLASLDELEDRGAAVGLDRADQVARARVGQRVEVLVVGDVTVLEPAQPAAGVAGEVVAHVLGNGREVLASLDPLLRGLGLVERGLALLVGRLRAGLRVLGEGLDEDEVGVHPLGERQPPRDFGVDLVVADRDAEVAGARREHLAVHERGGGGRRQAAGLRVQLLDLLVDDLVARAAGQLPLELLEIGDELHRQDRLALVEVGLVEARAGDVGHRPGVRLPVPVPRGRSEDPDRHGDRDREADDDQLLRAQLVLPARSMLPVEDRSGSECHR